MMFPDIEIIPARKADVKEIVAMIRELAEYEKLLDTCKLTEKSLAKALFSKPPAAEALIAFKDGNPAGMALYFYNFSTFEGVQGLYLEDLYVRPKFRKLGIGGALLKRLAEIAREKGCARMEWAVLEWNELAKSQYRKIGAFPMEEWRVWRLTGSALENFAQGKVEEEKTAPAQKTQVENLNQLTGPVEVYTDGGCQPNPGIGGWAAILKSGDQTIEISGGEPETTNNRMELMAVIKALESLPESAKVSLVVDSAYVKNGITKWMYSWKRNGWKTASGGEVKNQDLWIRLENAIKNHQVAWKWVKGHSGNIWNERCDELCTLEIEKLKKP